MKEKKMIDEKALKNLGMSREDFEEAIHALIEKGFVTETVVNGKICLKLTDIGKQIVLHTESNPKDRN
jgi:biotin operon repressor